MNNLQDSAEHTTERLAQLKQRAQQVLEQYTRQASPPTIAPTDVATLMEDLRIYQVELELQNQELRQAQQEADLARRQYQLLFDQMPLVTLVLDTHGMVDDCNASAERLLGKLPRVGPDRRFWRMLEQDGRKRVFSALRRMEAGQTLVLPELVLTDDAAVQTVMDAHLIALSIDYKLDRRVLVLLVDRSVELARRQDHQFYEAFLNSSDSLFYATDIQGQMLLANQAFLQLLGKDREAVIGQRRESFLPLRDAILHFEADQKVLRTKQSLTLEETVNLGPPRGTVSFLTRKFALHNLAGQVYGVGGISTDISAIKALQVQTLLSEKVFMTSEEGIIVTDAQSCILRVNPAMERLCGYTMQQLVGQHTRLFKSGKQDAAHYQAMWQTIQTQGHWTGEFNNQHADGRFYMVRSTINVVRDDAGRVLHYVAAQTDITLLNQMQTRLQYQASFDELTGLPNRSFFNDRLVQLLSQAQRHSQRFALLFIDLDRFKEVNDTLGHHEGDTLLRMIAQRLREGVRTEDTVARVGGDEFVVLLPNTDSHGAQWAANNLLGTLQQPVALEHVPNYRPTASVGLALYPDNGDNADLLLRNADMAMYGAKLGGRNRVSFYSADMSAANDRAFVIQTELAEAISTGQLRVYFQPKCALQTGELVGAEVLVRWQHPKRGLVLPGEFIRIAEKAGLLVALDQWVMNDALRQLGQWLRAGLWQPTWRMAVNQNVADLQSPGIMERLQAMLQQHQVPAQCLELEITEDGLMLNTPAQVAQLGALRDLGLSLAIDDFGTGYSSLAYLRQMPVSVLKIDQRFVAGMLTNDNDNVLVSTIVEMAHHMSLALVAEGIECAEQQARLQQMGCQWGQGYLFDKPISADDFAARWLLAPKEPS